MIQVGQNTVARFTKYSDNGSNPLTYVSDTCEVSDTWNYPSTGLTHYQYSKFSKLFALLFVLMNCLFSGCYSFKGISIDANTKTFYVFPFDNSAPNAVPTLPLTYTNMLIDKIRDESPLQASEDAPDIEFRGTITGFRVTSEAPTNDQDIAFNRLTIRVLIEYINNNDESKNWSSNFNHFNDFSADQNLIEVQDELIDNIGDQLMEDIFNKAFTDW